MTLRSRLNLPAPTEADEFDEKVQDVLRVRHANIHLVRFGRSGQSQHGIDGFDPLAHRGSGIVWQSTLEASNLSRKLASDLERMDQARMSPSLFIFAVGVERDAHLQTAATQISRARAASRQCSIEVLFWPEIRSLILDNARLGSKWYPELFPTVAVNAQVSGSIIATRVREIPPDNQAPLRRIWQTAQLARICGSLDTADMNEIEGALAAVEGGADEFQYWSNGEYARIGSTWYYPNGKEACIGSTWYYPNGKEACIGSTWYYPNGKEACIGSTWYQPSGAYADNEAAVIATGLGALNASERRLAGQGLRDLTGQDRRLAIVELIWLATPELSRRSYE